MIRSYFGPSDEYRNADGTPRLRFNNETVHDILARWREQAEQRQRDESKLDRRGQRYDPVTRAYC